MRSPVGFDLRGALLAQLRVAADVLAQAEVSAKSVHAARVHLKRARALARVGMACAPGLAKLFNQTARAAMAALAHSRDAAALIETAEAAAKSAPRKQAAALRALAGALAAGGKLAPPPDLAAAAANLRDLQALAQVWPEASAQQIRKGAERLARRARQAREIGRGAKQAEERHSWRKREKDRLYAAALLGKAWPRARKCRRSEQLTHVLGGERDARRLLERLEARAVSAGSAKADALATRALQLRLARLMRKANRLGARF
jgi:CHAD domain